MPDFTDAEIDRAFRLIGMAYGRPTAENPPPLVYPFDRQLLINLFDDAMIDALEHDAGKSVHGLAADLLTVLLTAGVTPDGRRLDVVSSTSGELTLTYQEADATRRGMQDTIRELRRLARVLPADN